MTNFDFKNLQNNNYSFNNNSYKPIQNLKMKNDAFKNYI